jgi:hypothetical protein
VSIAGDEEPAWSFSGVHEFRVACLREAVTLAYREDEVEDRRADDLLEGIIEGIREGRCPRCGGDYKADEIPAGSRLTACRCVPVCTDCGRNEAWNHFNDWFTPPGYWPIGSDSEASRRRDAGVEPLPDLAVSTTEAFLDAASGALISLEGGEGIVNITPRTGGWAELGFDEEDGGSD